VCLLYLHSTHALVPIGYNLSYEKHVCHVCFFIYLDAKYSGGSTVSRTFTTHKTHRRISPTNKKARLAARINAIDFATNQCGSVDVFNQWHPVTLHIYIFLAGRSSLWDCNLNAIREYLTGGCTGEIENENAQYSNQWDSVCLLWVFFFHLNTRYFVVAVLLVWF
jgi:hypothetical protein